MSIYYLHVDQMGGWQRGASPHSVSFQEVFAVVSSSYFQGKAGKRRSAMYKLKLLQHTAGTHEFSF